MSAPLEEGAQRASRTGNLKADTKLAARYKGHDDAAEFVKTGDGVRYRLGDGRELMSPSLAGGAVIGKARNGWKFWIIADVPLAKESKARSKRSKRAKPESPAWQTAHAAPEGYVEPE